MTGWTLQFVYTFPHLESEESEYLGELSGWVATVHSAVPVEGFMSKLILNLVIVPRTKFYIYSIVLLFIFQTKWNYPRTSAL